MQNAQKKETRFCSDYKFFNFAYWNYPKVKITLIGNQQVLDLDLIPRVEGDHKRIL